VKDLEVPLGNGKKTSGCRRCGRVFSTENNFNKHQRTAYHTDTPVTCLDPATLGLVKSERGIWKAPPRGVETTEEEDE
jgi:hypothetical protein